jgi:hypothetical protein
LTAAFAYTAMTDLSLVLGEGGSAPEKLAVTWAIVRSASTMPATLEDRAALDAAQAEVLRLAATLGYDEFGLKVLLRDLVDREGPAFTKRLCFDDAPA